MIHLPITILLSRCPAILLGVILLCSLLSCSNYSASDVEESIAPPVTTPKVEEAQTARLLQNGYRLVGQPGDEAEVNSPPEPAAEETPPEIEQVMSIPIVQGLLDRPHRSSAEITTAIKQSFRRIDLDISQPFSLMDAVALAVQLNRDIKKSYAQYQQALGSLEIARGNFDITLDTGLSYTPSYSLGTGLVTNETDSSVFSVGLSTLSRFGLQTEATFSATGNELNFDGTDSEYGKRDLSLVFTMPLAKDFGTVSTGAAEQSSIVLLEASFSDVLHQMSLSLNSVVNSYWDYTSAVHDLILSIDALARSRETLDDTRVLVENKFRSKSDLLPLQADVSNKISNRLLKEQQVITARNALALEIGFKVQDARKIPMPTTTFLDLETDKARMIFDRQQQLLDLALEKRQDYKSSGLQVKSARILVAKYQQDVLPTVDMVVGVVHTDFTDTSSLPSVVGNDESGDTGIQAGIQVELPLTNEVARGELRSQLGELQGVVLENVSVKESITGEIDDSVNTLVYSADILASLIQAEKDFTQAREDEFEKYKWGFTSIFDVLDVNNQLSTARSNTIGARASLAKAISDIRYATGTIIDSEEPAATLTLEDFSTPVPMEYLSR